MRVTEPGFIAQAVEIGERGVMGDDSPAADIVFVDQNKPPGFSNGAKQVECYRLTGFEHQFSDIIAIDVILIGKGLQGRRVNGAIELGDLTLDILCGQFK